MSQHTAIEWTDATWSPIRVRVRPNAAAIAREKGYTSLVSIAEKMAGRVGPHCEHVSPGCDNCYAGTNNRRCLPANGTGLPYDRRSRDLVEAFVDEKILLQPLRWKTPRRIFVENQSDLFGEWVPDELIDRVEAVMALCWQHTFQVLTKRAQKMLTYINTPDRVLSVWMKMGGEWPLRDGCGEPPWPLPNVHRGVSCEDQTTANERIPLLLKTPAAVRFISAEPLLGDIDLERLPSASGIGRHLDSLSNAGVDAGAAIPTKLDWVIVGGESGPGARPMHPDWVRSLRDQCVAAGVPFLFKQWGEWTPGSEFWEKNTCAIDRLGRVAKDALRENCPSDASGADGWEMMHRAGKHAAGALLDGREWREFPAAPDLGGSRER